MLMPFSRAALIISCSPIEHELAFTRKMAEDGSMTTSGETRTLTGSPFTVSP